MDTGNARLALALLLLWIAGVAFFAAFHPGGLIVNGKKAQNPADVLRYIMEKAFGVSDSGGSEPSTSTSGTETA